MKTKLKARALKLKGPIAVTLWAVPVDRENPSVRRFFCGGSKSMDNMTSDELTKALKQILKTTDRETQLKVLRAIMRYQNIDGVDL